MSRTIPPNPFSSSTLSKKARKWVRELHKIASEENIVWMNPHVVADDTDKETIILEWWNHPRDITIYITENDITYVKSWGFDMVNEMEDGVVKGTGIDLYKWLLFGNGK